MGTRNILIGRTAMCVAAAVLAIVSCAVASAQDSPRFDASAAVEIVSVPVTVTDAAGRFVFGLSRDDFDVRDGGVRQPLTQFSAERVPVSLAILLDISGSMARDAKARAEDDARWADTRRALERLVSRLDPSDEVLFAVFNEHVSLAVPWTIEHARIMSAFDRLRPAGKTAMLEAVKLMGPAFQLARHSRKAFLLISDGNDSFLPAPASQMPLVWRGSGREAEFQAGLNERQGRLRSLMIEGTLDAVRKSQSALYAVGMGTRKGAEPNIPVLTQLTADSGGYVERLSEPAEIPNAIDRICDELQAQYLLAFAPAHHDGRFHEISVTTRNRGQRVRARTGYVADRTRR